MENIDDTNRKEFDRKMNYEYNIHWKGGGKDTICNNDIPESIRMASVNGWAIITAANPRGEQLSPEENYKRNEEMRIFLNLLDIEYHKVDRVSVDERTYIPDGKEKVGAFLLMNVPEAEAREIALRHDQEHFVFFEMDPTINISVVGCANRFDGLWLPIFCYRD
jgi:hypothetical protein